MSGVLRGGMPIRATHHKPAQLACFFAILCKQCSFALDRPDRSGLSWAVRLLGTDVVHCAGLAEVDDQVRKLTSHVLDRRLVQVVLARTSDLIGKTVKETRFRSRFDAAIVALHREGARQRQKIGDMQLVVRSSGRLRLAYSISLHF